MTTNPDISLSTVERSEQKPASQLSNQEILAETRGLHAQFQTLAERYDKGNPVERHEIRHEMEPIVNRERELRQEFNGRSTLEMQARDRVPEQMEIGYSR